jgi:glycosyltransferase involved in cell wall biosynthesis
MKILIVFNNRIPALKYGGRERVILWLGRELVRQGHKVSYLVSKNSYCSFAEVLAYNPDISYERQIPDDIDLVHVHCYLKETIKKKPCIYTIGGNSTREQEFDINTVFLSRDHAKRHNGEVFVYNGLDPDEYGKPVLDNKRDYVHFLAKAAWRVKNVKGAIDIAKKGGYKIEIIGGYRLNFKMGFRLTPDLNAHFNGMLGGERKNRIINGSRALIFPVLWHEPFGNAIIESLYFGCAVLGTKYGSLPEIVSPEVGFLSNKKSELVEKLKNPGEFSPKICHEYVCDNFTAKHMTDGYLKLYEKVLNGEKLNSRKPGVKVTEKRKLLILEE